MQPDAPNTLEEVAAHLVERLQALMPAGGLYGRAALARLPEPVEHILVAVLDRRAAREAALPDSDWIDQDDSRVREAARQWREAARESARYPEEAWTGALAEGARQALRHLVEPAYTAGAFCFEGETGAIPMATVRARMTAFGPYPYLLEIAERYADRKGLERIDRAGLVSLLRRIDRRMTGTYGPAEWSALAAPLFTLIGPLPGLDGRVPADVLKRFFAARGADELAAAMAAQPQWSAVELHDAVTGVLAPAGPGAPAETPVSEAGSETIAVDAAADEYESQVGAHPEEVPGIETIHDVLAATADDAERPAEGARYIAPRVDMQDGSLGAPYMAPATDPAAATDPPAASGAAPPIDAAPSPGPDDTIGDDALFSTFAADLPSTAPAPTPVPEPEPEPATTDEQEPLWQRLARTKAAGAAGDSLSRLEARVLGDDAIAQRTWFVAEIAGGSEGYYRRLLEGLDAAGSWSDAWPVLAEAFKANDVDLYSEAAIAITDAAEARFRG